MKIKLYTLFFLISSSLFAQKVTTSIDSIKKKIGAEFIYTLKLKVDKKDKVLFPKDNYFGQLEVINFYKTDTLEENNKLLLIKKYGLTQFDFGKYTIPKMKIKVNNKFVFSDSLQIEVANVKVDTLKQKMFDVKPIAKTKQPIDWWFWLLLFAIIAIVAAFIYFVFIKKRKHTKVIKEEDKRSPIEKANAFLVQLDQKKYVETGKLKDYYSELANIARVYIEEELAIPAMESTTNELISSLEKTISEKKLNLSKEVLTNLQHILQKTDLIKFAKHQPNSTDISGDKLQIQETVLSIHKAIPTDVVISQNALEKQKQLIEYQLKQKQKQKKQLLIGGVIALVVLITSLLFFTKTYTFLKDNILGHPTKELAEGTWITSNYGNPAINISTPKVLKRSQQKINPQTKQPLNDIQVFSYGSLIDNFFIELATQKSKVPIQYQLDQLAENTIKSYEQQGVTNIILKVEDYDLKNGIIGKKAHGTMSVPTGKNQYQKVQYELILFSQHRGLQQILIICKDNDAYGKEMMKRIEDSIELQPAK